MSTPKAIASAMIKVLSEKTTSPRIVKSWQSKSTCAWWVCIEAIKSENGRRVLYSKANHFNSEAEAKAVLAELNK